VLADGTVVQLHPLIARLSASMSIEFVGNFRSVNGKWWKPSEFGADVVTVEQVEAGRELLRALGRVGVRHVFAHRQSSASRGNDPGPDLWANFGQWAIERLEFSDGGPGFSIGTGKPIPAEWRSNTTS